jgi:Spy/CpxP family protein refolding chaperone
MEMDKKKITALVAVAIALIVVAGAWISAKPNDAADLRSQQRAGNRPDPSQMRKQMLTRMTSELSLTPDQQTKVAALQEAMEPKMRALFEDRSGNQSDRMTKMQALMKDQQAQMAALLTPEQQKKLSTMAGPGMGGPPGMRGPGMGGPGMGGPPGMGGMGGPPPGMGGGMGMGGPPPGMNGGPPGGQPGNQ